MSTEKLGKAWYWRSGIAKKSHKGFVTFLQFLKTNGTAKKQLGYKEKTAKWDSLFRNALTLAERIESLAPDLAGEGPNPEYPWPPDHPTNAPAEYSFPLWEELTQAKGREFLHFTSRLLREADQYL